MVVLPNFSSLSFIGDRVWGWVEDHQPHHNIINGSLCCLLHFLPYLQSSLTRVVRYLYLLFHDENKSSELDRIVSSTQINKSRGDISKMEGIDGSLLISSHRNNNLAVTHGQRCLCRSFRIQIKGVEPWWSPRLRRVILIG